MVDVRRTVTRPLWTAVGPDLYRRNAFRITGLPTCADRRSIRARRQQVVPALELGADVDLRHGLPVRADEVKAAFGRLLEDPRARLVDELFWLWDGAETTCGCPDPVHHQHDTAVLAHCHVLDEEAVRGDADRGDLDELWADAARQWHAVLRRAATWGHLRQRVGALDDRRLDESIVDELRAGTPAVLLRSVVDLAAAAERPARLAGHARGWPGLATLADDLLEEAAGPLFEKLDATLAQVRDRLRADRPDDAITLLEQSVPATRRLRELVPADRYHRTAEVMDEVAIAVNNSALSLFSQRGLAVTGRTGKLLDLARGLATGDGTRATIERNTQAYATAVRLATEVREQGTALVNAGQRRRTVWYLTMIRARLTDVPGVDIEIDRLLADLRDRPADAAPGDRPRSGARKVAAVAALLLLGCLLLLWACNGSDESTSSPGRPATSVPGRGDDHDG